MCALLALTAGVACSDPSGAAPAIGISASAALPNCRGSACVVSVDGAVTAGVGPAVRDSVQSRVRGADDPAWREGPSAQTDDRGHFVIALALPADSVVSAAYEVALCVPDVQARALARCDTLGITLPSALSRLPDDARAMVAAMLAADSGAAHAIHWYEYGVHQTIVASAASPTGYLLTRWGDQDDAAPWRPERRNATDFTAQQYPWAGGGAPCTPEGRIAGRGLELAASYGLTSGMPGTSFADRRAGWTMGVVGAVNDGAPLLTAGELSDGGAVTGDVLHWRDATEPGVPAGYAGSLARFEALTAIPGDAQGPLALLIRHEGRRNRSYLEDSRAFGRAVPPALVVNGPKRIRFGVRAAGDYRDQRAAYDAIWVAKGRPSRAQVRVLNDRLTKAPFLTRESTLPFVFMPLDSYGFVDRDAILAGIPAPGIDLVVFPLIGRSITDDLLPRVQWMEGELDLSTAPRVVWVPWEIGNNEPSAPLERARALYQAWIDTLVALEPAKSRVVVCTSPTHASDDTTSANARFNMDVRQWWPANGAALCDLVTDVPNQPEYWNGGAPHKSLTYWMDPAMDPAQHPNAAAQTHWATYRYLPAILEALRAP